MKIKKAQALNATIIVIVIMVFLLIYLYYLPPETKKEIFYNTSTTTYENSSEEGIILHKLIGRIYPKPLKEYKHQLASFSAYNEFKYLKLVEVQNGYVYANVFDSNKLIVNIKIDPKYKIKSLLITPTIFDSNAELMFYFNNKLIYVGNDDFYVPLDLIKQKNQLVIKILDSGLNIFRNNYARFSINVFANVIDNSNALQRIPVFLETQEIQYCKRTSLSFFIDCKDNKKNKLVLMFNNYTFFNGSPNCRQYYKFSIPCSALKHSGNELIAKSRYGTYFFSLLLFKIKTQDNIVNPVYFDIPEEIYNNLDKYKINLSLHFVEQKNAEVKLNLNGFVREIPAKDYSYVINTYVKEKNNYVVIESSDIIDISDLIVAYSKE